MRTNLDSFIARLEELRKEVGGDCHVRVQETKQIQPGYKHPIDRIEVVPSLVLAADGKPVTYHEISIVPYLAP